MSARHRLESATAALVGALVRPLPRGFALRLGRGLGRILGALDRRHIQVAMNNLRPAFPGWDEAQLRRAAHRVYVHFGAILLDILWLDGRSREEILGLVEVEGAEHVRAAMAEGRGAILVTGHVGNWEMHGISHGYLFGAIGVVARTLDNPALDVRLCRFRAFGGNTVIYKQKALGQVLRLLRDGRGVAILMDQNVQDGVFVDFFGRPAATTTVAAALAAKTGCALIPCGTHLRPDGRYQLTYRPPVSWTASSDRDADLLGLTQRLTTELETLIRATPEQWLWIHRRWKTQRQTEARAEGFGARPETGIS